MRRKGVLINNKIPRNIIEFINEFKLLENLDEGQLKETIHNCNKVINEVLNNQINTIIRRLQKENIDLIKPLDSKATFIFKNNP